MDRDSSSEVPGQLLNQLLKGYDALHLEFKLLNDDRRELENKLSWAKQQHLELLKRFTPGVAEKDQQVFVDELEEAGACQQNGQIDWLEAFATDHDSDRRTRSFNIRIGDDAREKLRAQQIHDVNEVKIWSHTNGSAKKLRPHPLSVSLAMEQDFTIPGTPSKLGCPFVTSGGQRSIGTPRSSISRLSQRGSGIRSKRASFHDPIRAEICGIDPLSPAPTAPTASVAGSSAAACPIRFLDQHSPEEVAEYFEKHKHEIPRSHEVCIKRYQSNEESIRQLDAKYGNLVSMIQGLGEKHQPMLLENHEDYEEVVEEIKHEPELQHRDSVRKWATNVTNSLRNSSEDVNVDPTPGDPSDDLPDPEERVPHFDRPLKDVRVGESPSRPWGIQIPLKYQKAASVPSSEASAPAASPRNEPVEFSKPVSERPARPMGLEERKEGGKCPFDRGQFKAAKEKDAKPEPLLSQVDGQPEKPKAPEQPVVVATETLKGAGAPQMVFNGPVFIGYSVEQAMTIINRTGLGNH